jgi:ACT domain-containing protein
MSITISIKIPAKVQNVDKALELVGGVDFIAKVTTLG